MSKEAEFLLKVVDIILTVLAIALAGIWFGSKLAIIVFFILWASSIDSKLKAMDND